MFSSRTTCFSLKMYYFFPLGARASSVVQAHMRAFQKYLLNIGQIETLTQQYRMQFSLYSRPIFLRLLSVSGLHSMGLRSCMRVLIAICIHIKRIHCKRIYIHLFISIRSYSFDFTAEFILIPKARPSLL